MSHIRSKNTRPEVKLRKALHNLGYRYSLKYRFKDIRCKPDLTMVSLQTCIFVDGCFWHKCPKCYKEPETNRKYWLPKIEANVRRDLEQTKRIRKKGWQVVRIWEHNIRNDLDKAVNKITKILEKKRQ